MDLYNFPVIKAKFCIKGIFEVDMFSFLRFEPSDVFELGKKNKIGRINDTCRVYYSFYYENCGDMEILVIDVLDRLGPFEEKLIQIRSTYELEYTIEIVITIENSIDKPAIGLSFDTMKRMVELGIDFDIDYYLDFPEDDSEN